MKDQELVVLTRDRRSGVINKIVAREKDLALTRSGSIPHPVRVLVADDCEMDRELTIMHLGNACPFERDMVVECATNGIEALVKLRKSRFALAVLDWNLPHVGGRELLRTMRRNGMSLPVVVLSAQSREDIATDLESLAASFTQKNELSPIRFCSAIAVSLQLQGVMWKDERLQGMVL
jgi:CheY-like chemotaxis protein